MPRTPKQETQKVAPLPRYTRARGWVLGDRVISSEKAHALLAAAPLEAKLHSDGDQIRIYVLPQGNDTTDAHPSRGPAEAFRIAADLCVEMEMRLSLSCLPSVRGGDACVEIDA